MAQYLQLAEIAASKSRGDPKKQTTIHMIPKKDHINKSTIDSIIFDHNHIYNPYVIDFLITFHIQKKSLDFQMWWSKKGFNDPFHGITNRTEDALSRNFTVGQIDATIRFSN